MNNKSSESGLNDAYFHIYIYIYIVRTSGDGFTSAAEGGSSARISLAPQMYTVLSFRLPKQNQSIVFASIHPHSHMQYQNLTDILQGLCEILMLTQSRRRWHGQTPPHQYDTPPNVLSDLAQSKTKVIEISYFAYSVTAIWITQLHSTDPLHTQSHRCSPQNHHATEHRWRVRHQRCTQVVLLRQSLIDHHFVECVVQELKDQN